MPVLLHEDPRYFRKVHGSVLGRLGYSLTRVLITKTDSGSTTFNFAEVVGNGIGSSISNLYYPDERGYSDTFSRMGTQIATDSLSNVLKEFWPGSPSKRRLHKSRRIARLLPRRTDYGVPYDCFICCKLLIQQNLYAAGRLLS